MRWRSHARRLPVRSSIGRAEAAGSCQQVLCQFRMWRTSSPAGARASADHAADRSIAAEARPGDGAGVGAPIVAGHDFEVLVTGQPTAVLILDARIREVNVAVVVRQVVLASPPRDLLKVAVRPPIAILLASIAIVQESLIVA